MIIQILHLSILGLAIVGCSGSSGAQPSAKAVPELRMGSVHIVRENDSNKVDMIIFKSASIDQNIVDLLSCIPCGEIRIEDCTIVTDADWSPIGSNPAIHSLTFRGIALPAVRGLKNVRSLKSLRFIACTGVDDVLDDVRMLPGIENLDLSMSDMSIHGFSKLKDLPVKYLEINNTSLGDEIIPTLVTMRQLRRVSCAYSSVSDVAVTKMKEEHDIDLWK